MQVKKSQRCKRTNQYDYRCNQDGVDFIGHYGFFSSFPFGRGFWFCGLSRSLGGGDTGAGGGRTNASGRGTGTGSGGMDTGGRNINAGGLL